MTTKKSLALVVLVVLAALGLLFRAGTQLAAPTATDLLYVGDFETGSLAGEHMYCAGCGDSEPGKTCPTVVPAEDSVEPRAGDYMMKSLIVPKTDPCPYRVEAKVAGYGNVIYEFKIGSEYWLGFSVYIPDGQPLDLGVLAQFHGRPDADIGEISRHPVFYLKLQSGGYLEFQIRADSKENTGTTKEGREYEVIEVHDLGAPPADRWIDFVFHFKLDYSAGGDGFLEVYQDGQKVVDYVGANCYNDAEGPFLKIGVYNKGWKDRPDIGSRVAYHDELRIGDANASYEDVTPGDECPPDPPTYTSIPIQPTYTPQFTYTPAATNTPEPTNTLTHTATPTDTPEPTSTPTPACPPTITRVLEEPPTPYPTNTPYPTYTPVTTPVTGLSPANPNASEDTRKLLNWLADLPDQQENRVISGQHIGWHARDTVNDYAGSIAGLHAQTGKWVALVGTTFGIGATFDEIHTANQEVIIPHWEAGGLVTVDHFPMNPWTGGYYSDLRNRDLVELITPGTAANDVWTAELDKVAAGLAELQDAGVVVLWRPFHEMTYTEAFWWDAGAHDGDWRNGVYYPITGPFIDMWRHMFDYFTYDKGLDNLLWVYGPTGGTDNWCRVDSMWPGDGYVDLVGLDLYSDDLEFGPGDEPYQRLMRKGKPFGFFEVGPGSATRDGSWDTRAIVNAVRERYPDVVLWQSWHSWIGNDVALVDNRNASALLDDPWVITRDEVGWRD